jgi:DNA-binding PucR family transcriptional regulator
MTAGVGPTVREAATLKLSIRHALTAARWAELAGGNGALVEYEKIAHLQLLPSIVLSMSGDLRRVVGALDGLVAYDLQHGTDLAKTLNCFVTNRGSIACTASQLYIHRNTLRQRLRRIDELTGQPPESFENWLTAGLAARIIERSEDELASAPPIAKRGVPAV